MEAARATVQSTTPDAAIEAASAGVLRVLVGYDGGPGSRDALALARALCATGEVELTVASIRPYWPSLVGVENFPNIAREDERWIRRGASRVLGATPFCARVVAEGHRSAGLKELAEAGNSDLIVLGSSNRGRLGRVCPGSVGERLLEGAPCAVAIAPRGLAEADALIREIAVGYDGSRGSVVALRRAIGLAQRGGVRLLILGAVEISLGLAGHEARQPKDLGRADMERHLKRALQMVPPGIKARSRLLFGEPTRAILEASEDADLLVLGSRGNHGRTPRVILGTVAAAALRRATCPTLITSTDS